MIRPRSVKMGTSSSATLFNIKTPAKEQSIAGIFLCVIILSGESLAAPTDKCIKIVITRSFSLHDGRAVRIVLLVYETKLEICILWPAQPASVDEADAG